MGKPRCAMKPHPHVGPAPPADMKLKLELDLDKLVMVSCSAYIIFVGYVLNLLLLDLPIPKPTWLWLWALSILLMVGLGASTFVHEHQYAMFLVAFVGSTGIVGALLAGVSLLRHIAGFALSTAYWLGVRRHIGYPYVNLDEATKRAIALNTALLLMNVIAYILLPG